MLTEPDFSRFCINRNIVECKALSPLRRRTCDDSINRNIVECKENTVFTGICAIFVLIETSWNVKVIFKSCIIFPSSINRNIVECKACLLPSIISKLAVLIETSWNVKHISRQAYKQQLAVLIETSWNVKCI